MAIDGMWNEGRGQAIMTWSILRVAALAAGVAGPMLCAAAMAASLQDFGGYWTGVGSVTMANGTVEQVKCVATYKVGAEQLRQNLRCASSGYSINATADLIVKGNEITGSWEERTYSTVGSVTGRLTADGFNLSVKGPTFSAAMNLTATSCRQTINIAPQGLDVTKIAIGLGKC